ncbi:hypothetical protein ABW19_dt0202252 [Dactylella cylindrospora]|nr:hypothetical protein ABW19_dt0202252 [Dactylella cylindrospora]
MKSKYILQNTVLLLPTFFSGWALSAAVPPLAKREDALSMCRLEVEWMYLGTWGDWDNKKNQEKGIDFRDFLDMTIYLDGIERPYASTKPDLDPPERGELGLGVNKCGTFTDTESCLLPLPWKSPSLRAVPVHPEERDQKLAVNVGHDFINFYYGDVFPEGTRVNTLTTWTTNANSITQPDWQDQGHIVRCDPPEPFGDITFEDIHGRTFLSTPLHPDGPYDGKWVNGNVSAATC